MHLSYTFVAVIGMANALPTNYATNVAERAAAQKHAAARGLGDTVGGLLDDLTGELGVKARGLGDTVGGLLDDVTGLLGVGQEEEDDVSSRNVTRSV